MKDLKLLARLAMADARYRQALRHLMVWQDVDESRTASLLFMEGVTDKAREVLPPDLYTIFVDAAEANAELKELENELRGLEEAQASR